MLIYRLYIMGGIDLQEGTRSDIYAYTFQNESGAAGWGKITLKGVTPSTFTIKANSHYNLQCLCRI